MSSIIQNYVWNISKLWLVYSKIIKGISQNYVWNIVSLWVQYLQIMTGIYQFFYLNIPTSYSYLAFSKNWFEWPGSFQCLWGSSPSNLWYHRGKGHLKALKTLPCPNSQCWALLAEFMTVLDGCHPFGAFLIETPHLWFCTNTHIGWNRPSNSSIMILQRQSYFTITILGCGTLVGPILELECFLTSSCH